MNIPQNQNLHSQSFNSEFVEFVWRFTDKCHDVTHQLICKFNKDGTLYIEGGNVNLSGEYIGNNPKWSYDGTDIEILVSENISHTVDMLFNSGQDLIDLQKEVVMYLNTL